MISPADLENRAVAGRRPPDPVEMRQLIVDSLAAALADAWRRRQAKDEQDRVPERPEAA